MLLSFVLGVLAGAALLLWRNRYVERQRRRIPSSWPLKTRPLVNTQERRVWIWLTKVMFDQHILINKEGCRAAIFGNRARASQNPDFHEA